MKRKNILALIALIAAFALALTACGSKTADETTEAAISETAATGVLALSDWGLTAETWSSPNGATIHLTAVPSAYTDGLTAEFVVRLEGIEVANVPCDWDGTHFTAAAELNGADGYGYYVILTAADGAETEIDVNTAANPTDTTLINMASALESYCNVLVESSEFSGTTLTITGGSVEVQAPRITDDGAAITCSEAVLVLTHNGDELDRTQITLEESEVPSGYELDLSGVRFDVPALEDDQQLALRLDVTLSNGQFLTASGCTWSYIDGQLVSAVG